MRIKMRKLSKVISVVSFVAVLVATGEPTGNSGNFSIIQLALAGVGVITLALSTLTLVRMSKNDRYAEWSAKERSRQTEIASAELALLAGNGNKLASKLK